MAPQIDFSRPLEKADENERQVFNHLSRLSPAWHVLWGYFYTDRLGQVREGDFLVLGPDGGLMVIECKGCHVLHVDHTGKWCSEEDNPFVQLQAQWDAVTKTINVGRGFPETLTTVSALAVPNITRTKAVRLPQVAEAKSLILALEDLSGFPAAWERAFAGLREQHFYPNRPGRAAFFSSPWGARFDPREGNIAAFHEAEIKVASEAQVRALNHLPEHTRFAISGPVGTGKTWLLRALAWRWVAKDGAVARKLLFLCYNKALEAYLTAFVRKHAPKGVDHITVRSWESIVRDCFAAIGERFAPPEEEQARARYFREDVPAALELAVKEGRILPVYDALVVDEGQDHDTTCGALPHGWWSIYRALLHQPDTAPIAVAYDPVQRSPFVGPDRFDAGTLLQWFGPGVVRFSCPTLLRYTPAVANFLTQLAAQADIPFPAAPRLKDNLVDGAAVEQLTIAEQEVASSVWKIVTGWIEQERAVAEDILIITAGEKWHPLLSANLRPPLELVPVEQRTRGKVSHVSAGRCRGLDAKAVIVVGFYPFDQLPDGYRHSYFLAASRARQFLAIVHAAPAATP